MSLIRLTQGDTGPDTLLYLTDHDSGVPIDLTNNASAIMKFRAAGGATVLSTITLSVDGDPTEGVLKIVWPIGALNVDPGYYEGEITLTAAGGQIVTAQSHPRFYVQAQF